MDMGSRPAGQTSLEIGSQDGAGETDEENGWPGPSHPLDRDREGVIETNMDQEEDNNERASPVEVDNSSIAPSEPDDEAGKLDMDVESKELDDSSEDEDEEKRKEGGEIHPETVSEQEQGQNEVEDFEKIPDEQQYDQEVEEQQVEEGEEEQAEQHQEEQAGESEPEEEPEEVMRVENGMPAAVEPVVVCSSAVAADLDFVPQEQKEEEAEEDLVKPGDPEPEQAAGDASEMESLKPGMEQMEEVGAEPSAAPESAASLEVDQVVDDAVAGDSANQVVDEVVPLPSEPGLPAATEHDDQPAAADNDDDNESSSMKPVVAAAAGSVAAAAAVAAVASTASKEEKKKPAAKT